MSDQPPASWHTKLLEEYVSRSRDAVLITEHTPLEAPDGPKIVFANAAVERITGYTVDEVLGQTPRLFHGPETQRQELDRICEALEREEAVQAELINYTKTGDRIWIQCDIIPVSENGGPVTHYLSIQRDITDRKKVQEQREQADERFHLITGATNDVVWDWNVGADEIWRSENFKQQYGHEAGTHPSAKKDWHNHIDAEDRQRVTEHFERFLKSDEHLWSEEYRFRHANGCLRWVSDRAMAERDRNGVAQRVVGIMADVTAAREIEDRLNRTQRLQSLGKLTGGIAHDFNNLLTVIMGNSERLAERLPPGPLKEMAELSLSASESGSELVKRLLAFARRQPLLPSAVNLNERLNETKILLAHTLPETVGVNFIPAPGVQLAKVDATQFDTAIVNLCLNAKDAMPDGGQITIELNDVVLDETYAELDGEFEPGAYVMVVVSDTGIGMDTQTRKRAFEPFFTTKAQGAGTGLGLSMVYGFVKQSGGHVTIYSEPGTGTSVRLYFPVAETAAEISWEDARPDDISLPPLKVLIVEDNTLVLMHARQLLTELGLETVEASTVNEALQILEKTPDISLLFTDIVLPGGKDGVELAALAAELRPDLPVLFTTGYTTNAILIQERLDSSVSILSKPYRRDELVNKIRDAIENHRPR